MRVSENLILRQIAGENILIPVGTGALTIHGMITLSDSGLMLWQRLQKSATEEELVALILEEYEVDEATAREDVQGFLNSLRNAGFLIEEDAE